MNQYLIIINYYCVAKGYKNHKQVDVLSSPGEADLTADVNFSHLIQIVESQGNHSNYICTLSISLPSSSLPLSLSPPLPVPGCAPHGPISQNQFLHKMGIRQRLDVCCRVIIHVVMATVARCYLRRRSQKLREV